MWLLRGASSGADGAESPHCVNSGPVPPAGQEVLSKSWTYRTPEASRGKLCTNNALICDCTFIKRTALIEASAAFFFFFFKCSVFGYLRSTEDELTCIRVQGIIRCVAARTFFFSIEYKGEKNVIFWGGLSGKRISSQLLKHSRKGGKSFTSLWL